jgi:Isochorismatase family
MEAGQFQVFGKDTGGGSFREDFPVCDGGVVAAERWAQSGFAGTDLDQQLKQHGADHVIVIGMMASTCVESAAVRDGAGLSHHAGDRRDSCGLGRGHACRACRQRPGLRARDHRPRSLLAVLAVPR